MATQSQTRNDGLTPYQESHHHRISWALTSLHIIIYNIQKWVKHSIIVFWLLTKDDAATFVGPNTIFGLCGALAGPTLIEPVNDVSHVLLKLPLVVLFNWTNLLIFDLANQRLPESAHEDALNKPWRPVPKGLITSDRIRQTMLLFIPLVLAFNHLCLGTGFETVLIFLLTWLYNDLKGGDESWILRNVIIAVAFGLFNTGSLRVASGFHESARLTSSGVIWTSIISGVISTTMHVQDLKDQEGDRIRNRRSAPIVLGDRVSRVTVAVPVCFWSLFCTRFWPLGIWGTGPVALGAWVALRCIAHTDKISDRRTWEIWALWTATLYSMPCLYYFRCIRAAGS